MAEGAGAPNAAAQVRSLRHAHRPSSFVRPGQSSQTEATEEHRLGCSLQLDLYDAVQVPRRAECLAAVHAALEAGADVNGKVRGITPLHCAVRLNTDASAVSAAVSALAAAGADVRA